MTRPAFTSPRARASAFLWSAGRLAALAAASVAAHRRPASAVPRVLVIPPSSPGSLGDEAMMTAVVQHLDARHVHRDYVAYKLGDRWSAFPGPAAATLIDYTLARRVRVPAGLVRVGRAMHRYSHVLMLGADVLDGHYSTTASLGRWMLSEIAAANGAKAAILGCSFNDDAPALVRSYLAGLSPDVRVNARDPRSEARLTEVLGRPAVQVADLAFLLRPEPDAESERICAWADARRAEGKTVVGVNVNRQAIPQWRDARDNDALVAYFAEVVRALLEADPSLAVALVPHDYRGDASDHLLAGLVETALPAPLRPRVERVRAEIGAAAAKHIAGALDAAISGRMHFAIACLGSGVPVLGLVYQGKFEGLYEHFRLDPARSLHAVDLARPDLLVDLARGFIAERASHAERVAARLPAVLDAARANFAGFDDRAW